jgi:hypothetical protein
VTPIPLVETYECEWAGAGCCQYVTVGGYRAGDNAKHGVWPASRWDLSTLIIIGYARTEREGRCETNLVDDATAETVLCSSSSLDESRLSNLE